MRRTNSGLPYGRKLTNPIDTFVKFSDMTSKDKWFSRHKNNTYNKSLVEKVDYHQDVNILNNFFRKFKRMKFILLRVGQFYLWKIKFRRKTWSQCIDYKVVRYLLSVLLIE